MTMEGASEHTKISKEIGWERRTPIPLPTKERAKELARLAIAGDRDAYKQVFTYNRFALSPINDDELEIVNIIFTAFVKGREAFE